MIVINFDWYHKFEICLLICNYSLIYYLGFFKFIIILCFKVDIFLGLIMENLIRKFLRFSLVFIILIVFFTYLKLFNPTSIINYLLFMIFSLKFVNIESMFL